MRTIEESHRCASGHRRACARTATVRIAALRETGGLAPVPLLFASLRFGETGGLAPVPLLFVSLREWGEERYYSSFQT